MNKPGDDRVWPRGSGHRGHGRLDQRISTTGWAMIVAVVFSAVVWALVIAALLHLRHR